MRAVRYVGSGGIDGLHVGDVPEPRAAPDFVVVRIRATCINPGTLAALDGAPFKPARDLSGEVVSVGEGAQGFAAGDAVLGWSDDTAHAELAAVPAGQLIPKPERLSWDVAGSLYVSAMAAMASVIAVEPRAGEVVVVSGASGGVGLVAAQLAIRAGATVLGLARADNADWLKARGILPVVYGEGQEERIRAAAGGKPIDAFIDAFGSGYVDLALALGVQKERINTVVDFKAAKEHGAKAMGTRQAGGVRVLQELADLAASGVVEVPIAATFPLERVQDAYRAIAKGQTRGKVVLHPQE